MSTTVQRTSMAARRGAASAHALHPASMLAAALRRWLLSRWRGACRRAEDPRRRVPYY